MVTIIIERRCKPGNQNALKKLAAELRSQVIFIDGFYTAETLVSADDPLLFLTIHEWTDIEAWEAWKNSSARREAARNIDELLEEPQKESVFLQTYLAPTP